MLKRPHDLPFDPPTIVDVLQWRATRHPERSAFRFLDENGIERESLTYGDVNAQAQRIAAWLRSELPIGSRILLLQPPGLDYITNFLGCLYAGMIAVPVNPPRANARSLERLDAVVRDARATAAITSNNIRATVTRAGGASLFGELRLLTTNSLEQTFIVDRIAPPSPTDVAFLQYTSGSTAEPRGVEVTHANLLHNESMIYEAFEHTADDVVVGWLPIYHDMGLIGNTLQPLYAGAQCVLMAPMTFLQQPASWLEAISRYRGTTSGGPNFAYEWCLQRIGQEQAANWDLTCWRVAFCGAEPIRADTLERFAAAFSICGFRSEALYPCYGLAESTLMVTGGQVSQKPVILGFDSESLTRSHAVERDGEGQRLVGSGQARPGQEVRIVAPDTLVECRENEVGEIWVSGPSVARGYWGRDEESRAIFQMALADSAQSRFLRTGDLGFLHKGELFVVGRLKDLIIIRGRNFYPQDIETTAAHAYPGLPITGTVAFGVEVDGEEKIIIVQEVPRHLHASAVSEQVASTIAMAVADAYEITPYAVVLVRSGTVPKTSSGKIRRGVCRDAFLAGELSVIAKHSGMPNEAPDSTTAFVAGDRSENGQTAIEAYLQAQIQAIVQRSLEPTEWGLPLATLGIDSMGAVRLMHRVQLDWGIALSLAQILGDTGLRGITEKIATQQGTTLPPIHARPAALVGWEPQEKPTSTGQRALWFLHQSDTEGNASYNIAGAARVFVSLDGDAMHRAAQVLVNLHPSLRTVVIPWRDEIIQRIYPIGHAVAFAEETVTALPEAAFRDRLDEEAQRPFNLSHGPLFRILLFHRGAGESVILLALHHTIGDLWSVSLLLEHLGALYREAVEGTPFPTMHAELDYGDYATWQQQVLAGSEGEQLWTYWRERLAGDLPVLELPTDRPRPPVLTGKGAVYRFEIPAELAERVVEAARAYGTTPYVIALTTFGILLHRYTGQTDLLIGTPMSGRTRAEFASVVGYFVNTVVLRIKLHEDPNFQRLVARIEKEVVGALSHQDFPFALVVERLQPQRSRNRHPLVQAAFVWQQTPPNQHPGFAQYAAGAERVRLELGGMMWETISLNRASTPFDLTLALAEGECGFVGSIEYSIDLFDASTIERLSSHFVTLLTSALTTPDTPVSSLLLLSEPEQHQIVHDWNNTTQDYHYNGSLHGLVETQVQRTPESIALRYGSVEMTYAALNAQANRVANWLRTKANVGRDTLVGVSMERSPELVIALLAVLKAGGAYIPLEPTYPHERLATMLSGADVKAILSQEQWRTTISMVAEGVNCPVLYLDSEAAQFEALSNENGAGPAVGEANLAYVIYTSGSTGEPKGAMNTHGGICNRLLWMQDAFHLTGDDRVLQKTPFSFDVSVWEFFWPLITGARLIVAAPGIHRDSASLVQIIQQESITTIHFVPSMLHTFLDHPSAKDCVHLRQVICSGEVLSRVLQDRFCTTLPARLYNLYGPTEAAVDVTFWECDPETPRETVPIGRPIANTQIFILDQHRVPVPINVSGDLYIGGAGLARGYLGRPDLTAERFVASPFGEADQKLYVTGDIARYRQDGTIEYLGRSDDQIKIRGFRIEPAEISATIERHQCVGRAAVLARDEDNETQRLVAYVTPVEDKVLPTASELRTFLAARLPEYMVPSAFFFLATLPVTPNGKLDRAALPEPGTEHPVREHPYIAPRNSVEKELAAIWANVLRIDRVGVDDNFFDLGGHSLLATRVLARVRDAFGVELPLTVLFTSGLTIGNLAETIVQAQIDQADPAELAALLAEVSALSDEEVRALLGEET